MENLGITAKLKPHFYEMIAKDAGLNARLSIIIKNQNPESIISLAKVKHNVFSILKVANFIRDYYNEVMPEKDKICLLDMLENKAKIGCLN